MKIRSDILVLDFLIQGALISAIFTGLTLSYVFNEFYRDAFEWYSSVWVFITYLVLGGWQLLFSTFLYFFCGHAVRKNYLMRTMLFLIFCGTLMVPLVITNADIAGVSIIFAVVLLVFIPPFMATVRFVKTYFELKELRIAEGL